MKFPWEWFGFFTPTVKKPKKETDIDNSETVAPTSQESLICDCGLALNVENAIGENNESLALPCSSSVQLSEPTINTVAPSDLQSVSQTPRSSVRLQESASKKKQLGKKATKIKLQMNECAQIAETATTAIDEVPQTSVPEQQLTATPMVEEAVNAKKTNKRKRKLVAPVKKPNDKANNESTAKAADQGAKKKKRKR